MRMEFCEITHYYMSCKEEIYQQLMSEMDLSREISDEEMQDLIDDMVISKGREYGLSLLERQEMARELFYAIRRLDILQELIEDEEITEIMINGMGRIFL